MKRVKSSVTGKMYSIKASANCRTANVVYVIECTKCNKQYVGEMENALHIRMNSHRSDIKHPYLKKPVAARFNPEGHSLQDLSIIIIEQIHGEQASFCRAKESYWIQTL